MIQKLKENKHKMRFNNLEAISSRRMICSRTLYTAANKDNDTAVK